MPERLKAIWDRIVEWWNKFNKKQKALIISIVAVVVIAIIVLAVVLTRKTTIELITCEDTAQAGEVKSLLEDNNIEYTVSSNGLTFTINEEDQATANILLGTNSIPASGYTLTDALNRSFTTTESDMKKTYQLYLEERYSDFIEALDMVKSARVTLHIPDNDGTLLANQEESYATVSLTLTGEMSDEVAEGLARYVACNLGNETTDNIVIMDNKGNMLFTGGDTETAIGTANSQLALRQKYEQSIKKQVKDVMIGTDLYSNVEVGLNLDMDFDNTVVTDHEFYAPDGASQGYLDSESSYNSEAKGGIAATPGTDSNNDTTYMLQDGDYTESSVEEIKKDYILSEKLTQKTGSAGKINYGNSSISVVATTFVNYDEDTLKAAGELDEMSFDEYVAAHSDRVRTEIDDDLITMISNATGFGTDKISIIAYEVPLFTYSEGPAVGVSDIFQILLAVLIFALLGYVVFRSTRKERVEELEPELSVESLLQSTRESESDLEDIGYKEKSEARLLIEKFVDEKPEAVASLLRNWLNEDWD